MKKIRKGDSVIVLTGRDKGKKGTITGILENKFVVEGVNIYKKNVKPNPNEGTTGGTVDKTMPIHASNLMPTRDGLPFASIKAILDA